MMRKIHWLRPLQMGVAWHPHDIGVLFAESDQSGLQTVDFQTEDSNFLPQQPEPQIQGNLIRLRERPVCSLAPAGTRAVKADSMFM